MIRRIRRHVRRINYYSASRHRTGWTIAMDLALVLSLALALPAAWIADQLITRRTLDIDVYGRIGTQADDTLLYAMVPVAERYEGWRADVTPKAEIKLKGYRISRGFPFTSCRESHRAAATITELSTGQAVADDELTEAQREAIAEALQDGGLGSALASWTGPARTTERRWVVTVFNVGLWWLMMFVAAAIVLGVLRFSSLYVRARRAQRRYEREGTGACAACGYDMRGNAWAERCPECGALV